jgi:hypothetical protein
VTYEVTAVEGRWVALPAGHHPARRRAIPSVERSDQPFTALPRSAGVVRDFRLANDSDSFAVQVAADVANAEETFGAAAYGLGVVLPSAANAEIHKRDGLVCMAAAS